MFAHVTKWVCAVYEFADELPILYADTTDIRSVSPSPAEPGEQRERRPVLFILRVTYPRSTLLFVTPTCTSVLIPPEDHVFEVEIRPQASMQWAVSS